MKSYGEIKRKRNNLEMLTFLLTYLKIKHKQTKMFCRKQKEKKRGQNNLSVHNLTHYLVNPVSDAVSPLPLLPWEGREKIE